MKFWCDLSFREKCKIMSGDVNTFEYLSDYSFDVKQQVKEGENRKEELDKVLKEGDK